MRASGRSASHTWLGGVAAAVLAGACQSPFFDSQPLAAREPAPAPVPVCPAPDPRPLARAREHSRQLEREIARLREDIRQTESALVAIESGMRGGQTRANAVSALAEARIFVDRAARRAPWAAGALADARAKLGEADRQIQENHFGSAIFFASRAQRLAETATEGTGRRELAPRRVRSARLNLRGGPSRDDAVLETLPRGTALQIEEERGDWARVRTPGGRVGWVFSSLLSPPR